MRSEKFLLSSEDKLKTFDHLAENAAEADGKNEKTDQFMFLVILAMVFFFYPKLLKKRQSQRRMDDAI